MKMSKYLLVVFILITTIIYFGAGMRKDKYMRNIEKRIKKNPAIKIYTKEDNGLLTNWISDFILFDKYILISYDWLEVGGFGILDKESGKVENNAMIISLDDFRSGDSKVDKIMGAVKESLPKKRYYMARAIYGFIRDKDNIYCVENQETSSHRKIVKLNTKTGDREELLDTKNLGFLMGIPNIRYNNFIIFDNATDIKKNII